MLTPLNEELSKKCEGMLSKKECHLALKDIDNGKSPGSDGLSSEFYKVFWDGRYKTQVTGHRTQGTGHRSQGTGHRAQGTGHRLQGTGHRS